MPHLSQMHLRPLAAHQGQRGGGSHAAPLDEVAHHQRGAAPSAGLAVHVRQLAAVRVLCRAQGLGFKVQGSVSKACAHAPRPCSARTSARCDPHALQDLGFRIPRHVA